MFATIIVGSWMAAAPQAGIAPPPLPAGIEQDAACLVLTDAFEQYAASLPAEQQTATTDIRQRTKAAVNFYLGAVSARWAGNELRLNLAKAATWSLALPKDRKSAWTYACFQAIEPRIYGVIDALKVQK